MGHQEFEIPTGPPPLPSVKTVTGPPSVQTVNPVTEPRQSTVPRNRNLVLFGVATALLLVGGLLAVKLTSATETDASEQPLAPITVATEFLEAERVENLQVMAALSASGEECLGSNALDRLQSVIDKIDFKTYNLDVAGSENREPAPEDKTAKVSGVVDIGYVTTIEFAMVRQSSEWLVCGFSIE